MKQRVVIVDDQEQSRTALETLLEPLGLQVQTIRAYTFPYEGWDEHHLPDLVILSTDGAIGDEHRQLITKLLAHEVKVIVIAGMLDWQEARTFFLSGVYDVHTKNTPTEELVQAVSASVGNR